MVEASQGEGASLSPHRPPACKCGKRPTMCVQKLEKESESDWSPMKNELDDLLVLLGAVSTVPGAIFLLAKSAVNCHTGGRGIRPSPYKYFKLKFG